MAPNKTGLLPKAFSPEGETNRSLARFKAARLAKWNVNRAKSLQEMYELAFSLEALGRLEQALDVAAYPYGKFTYRNEVFFRVFLGGCLAEACYLLISMDRRAEANKFMVPLREHPINIPLTLNDVEEPLRQRGLDGRSRRHEATIATLIDRFARPVHDPAGRMGGEVAQYVLVPGREASGAAGLGAGKAKRSPLIK